MAPNKGDNGQTLVIPCVALIKYPFTASIRSSIQLINAITRVSSINTSSCSSKTVLTEFWF
ncbi:hypothetical protein [Zooshikella sp. RANM57]|uniref:hypothetical protein n=1 Tax=Zooshikella sp. RANM57 TaxID=3425863 RepID=UPI003D6FC5D8